MYEGGGGGDVRVWVFGGGVRREGGVEEAMCVFGCGVVVVCVCVCGGGGYIVRVLWGACCGGCLGGGGSCC